MDENAGVTFPIFAKDKLHAENISSMRATETNAFPKKKKASMVNPGSSATNGARKRTAGSYKTKLPDANARIPRINDINQFAVMMDPR